MFKLEKDKPVDSKTVFEFIEIEGLYFTAKDGVLLQASVSSQKEEAYKLFKRQVESKQGKEFSPKVILERVICVQKQQVTIEQDL